MRKLLLFIFFMSAFLVAYAQDDFTYTRNEKFTSRLYFPGSIGIDTHFNGTELNYKTGIVINTGAEYRPDFTPIFFRFDYDAITSRYTGNTNADLPTNVKNGTLHLNYFVTGLGYRKRSKLLGWYTVIQAGLEQRTYDRAIVNTYGYTINQISKKTLGVKLSTGGEYYVAEHFALVLEPAYYPGSTQHGSSNKSFSLSIGFTTTLF